MEGHSNGTDRVSINALLGSFPPISVRSILNWFGLGSDLPDYAGTSPDSAANLQSIQTGRIVSKARSKKASGDHVEVGCEHRFTTISLQSGPNGMFGGGVL